MIAPAVRFPLWGGTVDVAVTDAAALPDAERTARSVLAAVDRACSRFRPDSELARVERSGARQPVGAVLAALVDAALRIAEVTGGLVDPTVSVAALGYDRDIAALPADLPHRPVVRPAPGWGRVEWWPARRMLRVPPGVRLDLGATAKAWAADRAADTIAARYAVGALVSVAGDVAMAGPAPDGGWRVGVGDDHERPAPGDPVVTVGGGGLATSGTARRTWRRGGAVVHHIVDPRTGWSAGPVWRTVSVAAGRCVDANAASTAAVVRGADAPDWLTGARLPARLVAVDGTVRTVAGWPS
ncbi:FAD:protein FMN transferase [Actinocatenispora rupis]|uniref:FAD:protein FMN transferase n=1 Tax=Actinocatenispora rupis TaxID=519421 RepID=UPI001944A05B|nr:FAD:protein FMN transferase [Actinocatenispora rupis]